MNFALFYRKIWSYQKKAVPLHPLSKRKSTVTNGIKAITSDFGSENLGSIPGWSTKKPACRAFFEKNLKCVMGYGQPHKIILNYKFGITNFCPIIE